MAVRCGRCRCYHETSADVFGCYNGQKVAVVDIGETETRSNQPTRKQVEYANSLRAQVGRAPLTDDVVAKIKRRDFSELINDLQCDVTAAKALGEWIAPKAAKSKHLQAADFPNVTDGFYAVPGMAGGADLVFFQVQAPTEGSWKGCLFVKRIVGGHEPERVGETSARAWLAKVSTPERVLASKRLYGQQIGSCGECGRTLTNDESRAYGIGPVCLAAMGA